MIHKGRKTAVGYKDKMGEGIDATGAFSFARVRDAVRKIADAMGEKAVRIDSVDESAGKIWLLLFKTGAQKVMNFSVVDALTKSPDMTAYVQVKQKEAGKAAVAVRIGEANTSQQALLGFIPISPKSVHGITTYRDFCGHLASELKHIDRAASITRLGPQ
jgi:hypothetical protein